jgi:hypothetical protein
MTKTQNPDLDEATFQIAKRILSMPPKPHSEMKIGKRMAKAVDKESTQEIIFDTDLFDEELKRLGALAFKNFLDTRGSVCLDLSCDIFVSKNVPAVIAGSPGQLFLGLRISGRIKEDAVA